jgi:hypothetical protein
MSKTFLGIAGGIVVVVGIYSCQSLISSSQTQLAQQSICSTSDSAMMTDRGLSSDVVGFANANGYFGWCIPEFDDDQRLHSAEGGDEYGPVAHVIATPKLYQLTDPGMFDAKFVQVAIVVVDPEEPADMPAPYQRLGLGHYNCVYLRRLNPGPSGFQAVIVPPSATSAGPVCPDPPTSSVAPLAVRIDAPVSDDPDDYPPATRFIEGEHGLTLIGVRCGNRWCVIGPQQDFDAIPPSAHALVTALIANKQGRVKGWFDDQVLGEPDTRPKHNIHRHIRASAIPDQNLGNLRVQDFIGTTFKVVGKVHLTEQPGVDSKYARVFHFSQGTNTVLMRAEIQAGVKIDTVWIARVVDRNNNMSPDIKTRRTDHSAWFMKAFGSRAKMPATMRWRWDDKDEDLWAECDMGCCRVGIK